MLDIDVLASRMAAVVHRHADRGLIVDQKRSRLELSLGQLLQECAHGSDPFADMKFSFSMSFTAPVGAAVGHEQVISFDVTRCHDTDTNRSMIHKESTVARYARVLVVMDKTLGNEFVRAASMVTFLLRANT